MVMGNPFVGKSAKPEPNTIRMFSALCTAPMRVCLNLAKEWRRPWSKSDVFVNEMDLENLDVMGIMKDMVNPKNSIKAN
jgi:hypothetical protein